MKVFSLVECRTKTGFGFVLRTRPKILSLGKKYLNILDETLCDLIFLILDLLTSHVLLIVLLR